VNLVHACVRPHFESRFFSAEEMARSALPHRSRWVARQSPVKEVRAANPVISPKLDAIAFAAIMKIARPYKYAAMGVAIAAFHKRWRRE
jgi:hypothetical protein